MKKAKTLNKVKDENSIIVSAGKDFRVRANVESAGCRKKL